MINVLFFLFSCVYSYNLLDYATLERGDIVFYPCDNISPQLENTFIEVIENVNEYNLFTLSYNSSKSYKSYPNEKNTICNIDLSKGYGYTIHYPGYSNETDIEISNDLLYIDTTLYNVVIHEILHSLTLAHTTDKGVMNYKVHIDHYKNIKRDNNKIYISLDDYKGLKYVYQKLKKREMKCEKNKMIKWINNCVKE